MTGLMKHFPLLTTLLLSVLYNSNSVTGFSASFPTHRACSGSSLGLAVSPNGKQATASRRTMLRMTDEGNKLETVATDQTAESPPPFERKRSFFSRNVPAEKLNARKYFDIEERGELLAGPDRADEWGEELTEIGKWQRTKGPVYVQLSGLGFLAIGFLDYFALGNINGSASPLFTLGIFSALLGIALQRKA